MSTVQIRDVRPETTETLSAPGCDVQVLTLDRRLAGAFPQRTLLAAP